MKTSLYPILLGVTVLTAPLIASADTIFSDGTFNLSNYTIATNTANGGSITVSQHTSGGNPGSNLDVFTSLPGATLAGNASAGATILNNSFIYNPTKQGAVGTITASMDIKNTYTGVAQSGSQTYTFLLDQGGNDYTAIATSAVGAGFTHVSDVLTASMFTLQSGSAGAPQNPNFSSGAMDFGISTGTLSSYPFTVTRDYQIDNLKFDVAPPVPLPAAIWLMISGLGGLGVIARQRKVA